MRIQDVAIGMRVEGGELGSEDYDTGEVHDVNPEGAPGCQVLVAWDSLAKNWCGAEGLRPES